MPSAPPGAPARPSRSAAFPLQHQHQQQYQQQYQQQHQLPQPDSLSFQTPTLVSSLSASVRRTLFQARLGRRPTPAFATIAPTSPLTEVLRPGRTGRSCGPGEYADADDMVGARGGAPELERRRQHEEEYALYGNLGTDRDRGDDGDSDDDAHVDDSFDEIIDWAKTDELKMAEPLAGWLDEDEHFLDPGAEERRELKREQQKLAENIRSCLKVEKFAGPDPSEERETLLEAVKISLREKVAAIGEDSWMFERQQAATR